jgi:Uma2 family endonuclease
MALDTWASVGRSGTVGTEWEFRLKSPVSPSDLNADIEEKIRVYFACGRTVIFLVDTDAQIVTKREASRTVHFSREDFLTHAIMPDFALRASELFDRIAPKP